jgi:hypothetical protein
LPHPEHATAVFQEPVTFISKYFSREARARGEAFVAVCCNTFPGIKQTALHSFIRTEQFKQSLQLDEAMAISGINGGSTNLKLNVSVQDRAQKLMQEMDSDADGKVTKQEFAAMGEKMKANGPGRAEKGAAGASKGANAPAPPSADDLFAKADQDGDGSLSVTDLSAMMAEHETRAAARGGAPAGAGGPPPGGPPPGGPPPGGAPPGGATGKGASSSTEQTEDTDPADTNDDGTVSAAEKLIYELLHPEVSGTSESSQGA